MDDLYRDEILDHYKNPRHSGELGSVAHGAKVITKHASNHSCGDEIDAHLVVKDGIIVDMRWKGTGCAISQASMSMVSEWVIGKSLVEAAKLDKNRVLKFVGLPEIASSREKCALISLQIFSRDSE